MEGEVDGIDRVDERNGKAEVDKITLQKISPPARGRGV
jgi:hypothetical protein